MSTDFSEEHVAHIFRVEEVAKQVTSKKQVASSAWLILRLRRWRRYVPLKYRLTFNGLHGVITQKVELIITTAVTTSDPTDFSLLFGVVSISNLSSDAYYPDRGFS
jgi:hypothetical protein